MKAIEKGGLLLIPRVTDMRNGLFRPEVAWSKGRASDIIFGELHDTQMRAAVTAWQAASLAIMTQVQTDAIWNQTSTSIASCRRIAETLMATIC